MRMSLDGYSSKIRKVSRCIPTVSNQIILGIELEFLFTKAAPIQSITDIVLKLGVVQNAYRYVQEEDGKIGHKICTY